MYRVDEMREFGQQDHEREGRAGESNAKVACRGSGQRELTGAVGLVRTAMEDDELTMSKEDVFASRGGVEPGVGLCSGCE